MSEQRRISRRSLFRRGGASAGVAALSGSGLLAAASSAPAQERRERQRPNVVLIVADRMRSDYVAAYDDVFDDRNAKTPNIDELSDRSLRFRYATPDGMPAIPMRRGMLTGMRSYPFRDWRATAGMPAIPGFNKIYDFQPMMTELTAQAGVETVYVTDNPTFVGPRFGRIVRTRPLARSAGFTPTERDYLLPLGAVRTRREEPTQRVLAEGIRQLDALRGDQPFLLVLDGFDPNDAFQFPRQYVTGSGPLHDDVVLPKDRAWQTTIRVEGDHDALGREVRERYEAEVEAVDGALGRFLDKLEDTGMADRTVVIFVSDGGLALGEQGVFGSPAGVWHRRAYHVPFLLKDPEGRWAGDTSSWFVSSYDIPTTILAYLGIVRPGKMQGEDLTTLLEEFDLPSRPFYTTAIDTHIVVGDRHFLLIGRSDQDRWRLYESEDEDEPDEIRTETVKSPTDLEELRRWALTAAGGTLPDFGDASAVQPREPDSLDKRVADDGTLDEDEQEANELR